MRIFNLPISPFGCLLLGFAGLALTACRPASAPPEDPAAKTEQILSPPTPAPPVTPVPAEAAATPAPRMGDKLTSEGIRLHLGQPGVARIAWGTQSEENSFGFHVMRGPGPKGPFVPANKEPLLGAGNSATPINYEYYDTDVKIGEVYYYYVREIALDGKTKDITEWMRRVVVSRLNLDKVQPGEGSDAGAKPPVGP